VGHFFSFCMLKQNKLECFSHTRSLVNLITIRLELIRVEQLTVSRSYATLLTKLTNIRLVLKTHENVER
jgi:hypothetical protein